MRGMIILRLRVHRIILFKAVGLYIIQFYDARRNYKILHCRSSRSVFKELTAVTSIYCSKTETDSFNILLFVRFTFFSLFLIITERGRNFQTFRAFP